MANLHLAPSALAACVAFFAIWAGGLIGLAVGHWGGAGTTARGLAFGGIGLLPGLIYTASYVRVFTVLLHRSYAPRWLLILLEVLSLPLLIALASNILHVFGSYGFRTGALTELMLTAVAFILHATLIGQIALSRTHYLPNASRRHGD